MEIPSLKQSIEKEEIVMSKEPVKSVKKPPKEDTTKVLVVRVPLDSAKKLDDLRKKENLSMDGMLNRIVGNFLRNE